MAEWSGSFRRYFGGVAISFGVGVGYALLGATMVASTTSDPYQPSPGQAALADLFIWVLAGVVFLPLVLGGTFLWTRRSQGVAGAPGCAAILLSAGCGIVLGSAFLFVSPGPTPSGGWVESRTAGYIVHVPTLLDCSGHPAMGFAPGVVGEAPQPGEDCCSIAWWSKGRSGSARSSVALGPDEVREPTGGPWEWSDLDGFADYLSGTGGPAGDGFARTVLELEVGPAIRIDDGRTRPSSAYLLTDGTRYYSVACSAEDAPGDRWLSMARTFQFLPVEE